MDERKLRILQLNKYYAPFTGGIETVVQNIAEGLSERTEMRVLVCNTCGKTAEDTINGVSVRRSGRLCKAGPMSISLRYLADVKRELKNADAVLLHMPYPWGDLALLLSGYKGKVALWWHSDVVRQRMLLKLYKPLMRWTLKRADVIFTATRGHIEGSEFLGEYQDKCCIVPFGVDDAYLTEGAAYLAAPHTQAGPLNFLFIGRMIYYKGCDVLLDAFAQMRDKSCTLTMVGAGELLPALRAQAERLHIAERVCFTGGVSKEELKKRIEACDVFVLPSIARSEAFALVQIETMAYGKPVINTNLPSGVPYVSLDGVTGLTVPPSDAPAFARAMDALAADPALRAQYGKNARARVEAEYRMDTMMARVLARLQALCAR